MAIKTAAILGAGASLSAGYPLAKGVVAAIERLAERLQGRGDSAELQQWCGETQALMTTHGCSSIDELAFVLRNEDRGQAVLRAKAVMTALFLDLESEAGLTDYRRAVRGMIDLTDLALPENGQMRVPSSAFCISYNYDRCLEAAIYREVLAAGRTPSKGYGTGQLEVRVQRLINSGCNTMKEQFETIDTSRFALLKMHGTIGTLWDHDYPSGKPLCDFGKVTVNDELLAAFKRDDSRHSPAMIFFPWEIKSVSVAIRPLIEDTDRAAKALLADVEQLTVIGYSFHQFNSQRLEGLLANAKKCKVIDIYDPSAESHRRLGSLKESLGLRAKIVWHSDGWNP